MTQICYYILDFNIYNLYKMDASMVEQQNENLSKNITIVKDKYSTDNQKAYYINEKVRKMDYYSNVFLFVYVLVGLLCIYILFMNKSISTLTKVIIILFIIFYPFIGPPLFSYLYKSFLYFLALFQGKPFEK